MSIFNKVTKTFQWGDKTVIMETGEIARQATGAVLVDIDPMNDAGRRLAVKGLERGQRADALCHPAQIAGFAALRLCGIANEGWQRAIDLGHRRRQLGQLFDEYSRHEIFRHG